MKKPYCLWTFWTCLQYLIKSKVNRICQAQNSSWRNLNISAQVRIAQSRFPSCKHYIHITHTRLPHTTAWNAAAAGSRVLFMHPWLQTWAMKYTPPSPACLGDNKLLLAINSIKRTSRLHWHYRVSHSIWWVNHTNRQLIDVKFPYCSHLCCNCQHF